MKKILFVCCSILLTAQQLSAQDVFQGTSTISGSDIVFGPKVGLNMTRLIGDGLTTNGILPGFHVGGAVEIPISGEFYFAPELLFSLQGTRGSGSNIRLGYLNIPLMGKYHITEKIAVEFGPQLGILVTDNAEDFNLITNSFDFGLGVGGGYRLNDNFYFQLRINAGFLQVIENFGGTNAALQMGAIYYIL
ncbi:PorT family protein [Aggregatimonas sangjinii]|uniref:PorT family protein n=1 Tax=Aggregatimonas sangjinii TaxID=2583587 RepID=A0A5B7SRR3_9FLAO|nr:porin family protein [Aggregatimonas sangjinii]QCW99333.1 PorT family protein [Aggregatimonas sangjinii]